MGAYQEELHALRQRTPIGVRHGLVLLQQTNGDVAAAESLFQQELTRLVAHQAQVPDAAARHALERADYDVPRTLQQLEQARYSLTQRILRRRRWLGWRLRKQVSSRSHDVSESPHPHQ